jgi:hypothetical protein
LLEGASQQSFTACEFPIFLEWLAVWTTMLGGPGVRMYDTLRTTRLRAARMLAATIMPERMNTEPESARFHAGTGTCPGGMICNMLNLLLFKLVFGSVAGVIDSTAECCKLGSGIVHASQMISTADVLRKSFNQRFGIS